MTHFCESYIDFYKKNPTEEAYAKLIAVSIRFLPDFVLFSNVIMNEFNKVLDELKKVPKK